MQICLLFLMLTKSYALTPRNSFVYMGHNMSQCLIFSSMPPIGSYFPSHMLLFFPSSPQNIGFESWNILQISFCMGDLPIVRVK